MQIEKKPIISAIVAMDENRLIGADNALPWHLPADLKHFKIMTTGHPILMGRKTYESIGRPLPNRSNIIMTKNENYKACGCKVVTTIDDAIHFASNEHASEIFIIGGASIYQQLLPITQIIYLTIVHHQFKGDTYFPQIDLNEWIEIKKEAHLKDEMNLYDYTFLTLKRKS